MSPSDANAAGYVHGGTMMKLIDEAAALGHLESLDDAIDKYRGYGVRCQFYYQSLGQLKKCWPDGGEQTRKRAHSGWNGFLREERRNARERNVNQ